MRGWQTAHVEDGPEVIVTRHAIKRYGQRGRTLATTWVRRQLRDLVLLAVEEDRLLDAGNGTHLVPVQGPRGWLCLVVGIKGPRLKPHPAVLYTVLTLAMAIETFGHVPGLISATTGERSVRTA
jgi:hypothetical protein